MHEEGDECEPELITINEPMQDRALGPSLFCKHCTRPTPGIYKGYGRIDDTCFTCWNRDGALQQGAG